MNKIFMKVSLIALSVSIFLIHPVFCFDGVIICNKDVPENSLTVQEVKDIFTWNKKTWEDGTKITFVLLKKKDIFHAFAREYIGKSYKQYEMSIKNEIFINGYKMPKSFKTEEQVISYVSKTKGAIGFISKDPDTWLVKPLAVK